MATGEYGVKVNVDADEAIERLNQVTKDLAQITRRGLTVGDAIAVLAFLGFIVGWFYLGTYNLDDGETKDWSVINSLAYFILVFGPLLWAAGRINDILGRKS